jgi:hypothetical protein
MFDTEGIKMIIISFTNPEVQSGFNSLTLPKLDTSNKEYGVDWVWFGFIAGGESAMAAWAADFDVAGNDAYGTPMSELPLMNELNDMNDIDLHFYIGGGGVQESTRQFSTPYNIPQITAMMSMTVPDIIPYYNAGIVVAYLEGLPGAAQYESATRDPGSAIATQDAMTLSMYFLVALIAVVNLAYISRRLGGEL